VIVSGAVVGYAAGVEPEQTDAAGPQPAAAGMPVLPWQKPPRRHPAKQPLTRDRIVAAALVILDRDGLDAVTTRRVAEALDTGSASLYAHVANRDELVELMVDRVAADIQVPAPDPACWQDQIRDYARHAQQVWTAHADIARASLAMIPTGPERLRVIEGLIAILRAAGLPDHVAAWAVDRLQMYIEADVYEGWLYAVKVREGLDVWQHIGSIRDYYRALPADRFPLISSLADTIMTSGEERFEFGLDLFIGGLAARLGSR
jgi:AcrR family transcriptional regulator